MELEFTGERIVPGRVDDLLLTEHLARYHFAASLVEGCRVLDLGCGSGYGSATLLRGGAELVLGVDVAPEAVAYARDEYGSDRAAFLAGDARRVPFADGSFDRIACFELIEHVEEPELLLREAARLLKEHGLLVVSTPNARTYRKEPGLEPNPFHVREYELEEFRDMLTRRFRYVRLFGQAFVETVRFSDLGESTALPELLPIQDRAQRPSASVEGDYFIAVCGNDPEPVERSGDLLFLSSRNVLARFRDRIAELEQDLNEKREWAYQLDREIVQLRERYASVHDELNRRSQWAQSLQWELTRRSQAAEAQPEEEPASTASERLGRALEDMKSMKEERPRVLVVASAPSDEILGLADDLVDWITPNAALAFAGTSDMDVLRTYCQSRSIPFFEVPRSLGGLLKAASMLRRGDFLYRTVTMARHSGYSRLKLLGLLLGPRSVLVFNENRDFFNLGVGSLLRHGYWRAREVAIRRLQLVTAAWSLYRQQGWKVARARLRERNSNPRLRRSLSRLKNWGASLSLSRVELPATDSPRVSIVIPAMNQWGFTWRCLQSIAANTRVSYEVILVDNASTDGTRTAERKVRNLRVVRMTENQGFVGACNAGLEASRGGLILFLNNDIVTTPGWLEPMVALFDRSETCGAVGAKLVYPDGRLQEAGGIIWKSGDAWNFGRDADPTQPQYNYVRQVDYCSGAALMARADVLREIGGFSTEFSPGYWEDVDLCFTIRASGRSVWYQPASVLYHFEGASSGRSENRGMKRYQRLHAVKFRQKWRDSIAEQVEFDPRLLFQARDRNRGPAVLVVDHYVPTFDRDAGSAFMYRLLRTLVDLGYRVVFWPDNRFRSSYYTDRLQEIGIEVRYGPMSIQEFLNAHGRHIDHAIVYRSSIAEPYLPVLQAHVRSQAYVAVDLEHVRESRRGEVESISDELIDDLRERERRIVERVDCVAAHSQVELDILRKDFGIAPERLFLLPLPVLEDRVTETGFEERRGLAFVGSTHPPNVDAVRFFVDDVLPLVEREIPGIRLHVIGDVCNCLPELARDPRIELHGFVEDLIGALDKVRAFVAPIRYGAGIKGKILTAMKVGVPVVSTPVGVEGIGVTPGVHARVAETPETMAEAIVRLYTDEEEWWTLRRGGLELVAEENSDELFRRHVHDFMKELRRRGTAAAPDSPGGEDDVEHDPRTAEAAAKD